MKVVLCHTYYRQRGGEDESFEAESRTLAEHGHEVILFTRHNDAMAEMNSIRASTKTIWNRTVYRELRLMLQQEQPDVLHCTNTFPLLSPAVYAAARREGIPVVQSLRNYRMLCPSALFLRDGKVCEDCLGKSIQWPAIQHSCYRGSRGASLAVVAMNATHRALGTWQNDVDLYFSLTEFARQKFIAGGIRPDRITVKPNCVHPDPGAGSGEGGYMVFAGRLSEEKGIETLLAAWEQLERPVTLKIVGDGPLANRVQQAADANPNIEYLGKRPLPELLTIMGHASCLIICSIWYETFGRTIIEAYAKGTPVIASRMGAMAELVEDDQTGMLFTPGDPTDLARTVNELTRNPERLARMRLIARQRFLEHYTAEANCRQLISIYHQARANSERRMGLPKAILEAEEQI